MTIKPLLAGAVLAFFASTSQAAPFAYVEGPNGLTMLYREKCSVGTNPEWKRAAIIGRHGRTMDSCWGKHFEEMYKKEVVTVCIVALNKADKMILDRQQCMVGAADTFIAGNPIPPRAFK